MPYRLPTSHWSSGQAAFQFDHRIAAYTLGLSYFNTEITDESKEAYPTDLSVNLAAQQADETELRVVPRLSVNGWPANKQGATSSSMKITAVGFTNEQPGGGLQLVRGVQNGSHSLPVKKGAATSPTVGAIAGWNLSMPPGENGMSGLHVRTGATSDTQRQGYLTADVNMRGTDGHSARGAALDGAFIAVPSGNDTLMAKQVVHQFDGTPKSKPVSVTFEEEILPDQVAVLLTGVQFSTDDLNNEHLKSIEFGLAGDLRVEKDRKTVHFPLVGRWDTGSSSTAPTLAADSLSVVVLAVKKQSHSM